MTEKAMFCFQCEQTATCAACTGSKGTCGKNARTALLQDELTGALVALARAAEGTEHDQKTASLMLEGMFACVTNVSFDDEAIASLTQKVRGEIARLVPPCASCAAACGRNDEYDLASLWNEQEDIRSLKSLLLFGMRGVAAYAYHAQALGKTDDSIIDFIYHGMRAIGMDLDAGQLLSLVLACGEVNLTAMALLEEANIGSFGSPEPTTINLTVEPGPFIVVTGHDLNDLAQLLRQTEGKGINVYTHGEMLPANAYPELKKYQHLKGNYGTAWHNQQDEFKNLPAPILWTTNCLMIPDPSYADRVFTTGPVSFPGTAAVDADENGNKDFSALISKAIELGGWAEEKHFTGINGGTSVTTGFGYDTVMSVAPAVIEAVKGGSIKHFVLLAGCDGQRRGRQYYTDFAKQAPSDSVILTLGCGKFRFNDLDMGNINGIPRLLDIGQCNDAYGAIKIASALANAFDCEINDLPLSMVLSWYEQKAVCILLTLLHLGVKNIYLGPTLPAFVSPAILQTLVENYGIRAISTPENDWAEILS